MIAIAEASEKGEIIDLSKLITDLDYPECAEWYWYYFKILKIKMISF